MPEIWEYDESLFRTPAQVEELQREQQESEAHEYVLWERVMQYGHPGTIVQIMETNGRHSYLVEDERSGFRHWYNKRDLRPTEQLPVQQEVTFNQPYQVGAIVSYHGHDYRVVSVDDISESIASDAEDANDAVIASGSYAKAVLIE